MLSYAIVGSGYRSEYYARIARTYPELFRAMYLCRSEEKPWNARGRRSAQDPFLGNNKGAVAHCRATAPIDCDDLYQASGSRRPRLPSARRYSTLVRSVSIFTNTKKLWPSSSICRAASSTDMGRTGKVLWRTTWRSPSS